MRGQNGITLVALVITIIVLLILAVVTIAAVTNTGILNYADNSVNLYEQGADRENTQITNYTTYLNQAEQNYHANVQ